MAVLCDSCPVVPYLTQKTTNKNDSRILGVSQQKSSCPSRVLAWVKCQDLGGAETQESIFAAGPNFHPWCSIVEAKLEDNAYWWATFKTLDFVNGVGHTWQYVGKQKCNAPPVWILKQNLSLLRRLGRLKGNIWKRHWNWSLMLASRDGTTFYCSMRYNLSKNSSLPLD